MIAMLKGVVADVRLLHVVLDVSGVGYLVAVRNIGQFTLGQEAVLHIHMAVRESAMDLYGFLLRDEREMFEHLLKIPKIGPKTAMQILSQADIELLRKAVTSDDPTYLSKMSGIGKKSAEKIVAGLKDVFESIGFVPGEEIRSGDSDVIDALLSLGYSQKDARDAVQKIPADITETNARVKAALKHVVG